MTRQKKTLNVILREMDSILERTTIAQESYGATMLANITYSESLQAKTADFKNSMEELFSTIIEKDALKTLIESGTSLIDTLVIIDDNFGILNLTIGTTITLLVALRGTMIAGAVASFGESILITSMYIKELGVVAGLAQVGVGGLTLAMGGLGLVVGGLVATTVIATKAQQKQREEIQKMSGELDIIIGKWEHLNERELENARVKALLAKDEIDIDATNRQIERSTEIVERYTEQLEEQDRLLSEGSITVEEYKENVRVANIQLENHSKVLSDAKDELKTYTQAEQVLSGNIPMLNQRIEEGNALQEYWTDRLGESTDAVTQQEEALESIEEDFETQDDIIKRITKDYEFMSEAGKANAKSQIQYEIDKTKKTKEEVLKRIKAYEQEFAAFKANAVLTEGFLSQEQFNQYKEYQNLISSAKAEVESLTISTNKYQGALDDLDKSTKSTTKELTAQEKAILELEAALKKLETQEEITDSILEKNNLRQQQIDTLEDLKDIVDEGSQEWLDYELAIKRVNQEISDSLNDSIERSTELLEKYNEKLEEQSEILENQVAKALEDQIEALELAEEAELDKLDKSIEKYEDELDLLKEKRKEEEDEAKRQKILLDLEKARLKLTNIQSEKNTRVYHEGVGFVYEADPRAVAAQQEEVAKLEQDLLDNDVEASKDAEEQKLQDKIDALKDQEKEVKKSYDKQVKEVKNALDDMSDITKIETGKQNLYWNEWLNENSAILDEFENDIDDTIKKIAELNNKQVQTQAQIDSNTGSSGGSSQYTDTGDPNTVLVKNKKTGQVKEIDKDYYNTLKNDPDIGDSFERLNTGGRTLTDGMAMLHKNEVVLNPAQVSKTLAMNGINLGSASQNANNLWNLANQPKIAMAGASGGTTGGVTNNYSIGELVLKDINNPQQLVQDIKRYFNNRS